MEEHKCSHATRNPPRTPNPFAHHANYALIRNSRNFLVQRQDILWLHPRSEAYHEDGLTTSLCMISKVQQSTHHKCPAHPSL